MAAPAACPGATGAVNKKNRPLAIETRRSAGSRNSSWKAVETGRNCWPPCTRSNVVRSTSSTMALSAFWRNEVQYCSIQRPAPRRKQTPACRAGFPSRRRSVRLASTIPHPRANRSSASLEHPRSARSENSASLAVLHNRARDHQHAESG